MDRPERTARVITYPEPPFAPGVPEYRAICIRCAFIGTLTRRYATANLQATLHRCGALPIVPVES